MASLKMVSANLFYTREKFKNFSLLSGSGPVRSDQPDHLILIRSGPVWFKNPDPVGS